MPFLAPALRGAIVVLFLLCASVCAVADPANPYESELRRIVSDFPATPTAAAALVHRATDLRPYLDNPSALTSWLLSVAADQRQHRLVRDLALYEVARMKAKTGAFPQAASGLRELGFVQSWAIAETGVKGSGAVQTLGAGHWRRLPDAGPQSRIVISDLVSSSPAAFATRVFSQQDQAVALRFGTEAAVSVYVNGDEVYTGKALPQTAFDQRVAGAQLRAGWNLIVVRLVWAGEQRAVFGLRVTGLAGGGIQFGNSNAIAVSESAPAKIAEPAEDLVAHAERAASGDTTTAAALQTFGELTRIYGRGTGHAQFEAAVRREPTSERWFLTATACPDAACRFAALSSALRINAKHRKARMLLAEYYADRQQLRKAESILAGLSAEYPEDAVVRERLSRVRRRLGLPATIPTRDSANSTPLIATRERALHYDAIGRTGEALAMALSVLQQDLEDDVMRELAVRLLQRKGDVAALSILHESGKRLRPLDPAPLVELVRLTAGSSDIPQARAYTESLTALAPFRTEVIRQLATMNKMASASSALLPVTREVGNGAIANAYTSESEYLVDALKLASESTNPQLSDSGAVVLADVRVQRGTATGLSSVRVQQVVRILDHQRAQEYSSRSIQFAPETQQLQVLRARVVKPNGEIVRAHDAGDTHVADSSAAMYYDVRARQLKFAALEPGDTIELDYRITPVVADNPYGEYFSDLVVFAAGLPQRLKRYVLLTPADRAFHVVEDGISATADHVTDNQRIRVWEARNTAPIVDEPRRPSITELAAYVHVSSFKSWDELGRWYSGLIAPQFEPNAELRAIAARITSGLSDELEKIKAVHEFVLKNTRYVALEFGIHSYKPYAVSQAYARRFGDCKDKAALIIALLREAGIEAHFALVRTRKLGNISEHAVSVAPFNHAVAYIPRYDLWLDGTADYAGVHEVPLEDQGGMALVVSLDGRASLNRIPVTTTDDNYTRRNIDMELQADGRVRFSGTGHIHGEDAPGMRRKYEFADRWSSSLRDSLAEVVPAVNLDDVVVEGTDDLQRDVELNFRGTLDTFAGRSAITFTSTWLPRTYLRTLAPLSTRVNDLLLPAPWTTDEQLRIALPRNAVVESIPADTVLDTPFGFAVLRYERDGRNIVVRSSVQFRTMRVSAADYPRFRAFCEQVERAFKGEFRVRLEQ